jgi:hypothetical protein
MGASFYIGAESQAEWDALESEGAPDVHLTYGTAGLILAAIGVEFDYCGTIAVEDLPEAAEVARREAVWADLSHGKGWAFERFAEVAEAAVRLRRGVAWS